MKAALLRSLPDFLQTAWLNALSDFCLNEFAVNLPIYFSVVTSDFGEVIFLMPEPGSPGYRNWLTAAILSRSGCVPSGNTLEYYAMLFHIKGIHVTTMFSRLNLLRATYYIAFISPLYEGYVQGLLTSPHLVFDIDSIAALRQQYHEAAIQLGMSPDFSDRVTKILKKTMKRGARKG